MTEPINILTIAASRMHEAWARRNDALCMQASVTAACAYAEATASYDIARNDYDAVLALSVELACIL